MEMNVLFVIVLFVVLSCFVWASSEIAQMSSPPPDADMDSDDAVSSAKIMQHYTPLFQQRKKVNVCSVHLEVKQYSVSCATPFLNFDPMLHNLRSSICHGTAIYVSNMINATELP